MYKYARKIYKKIRFSFLMLASKSNLISGLYYLAFPGFYGEHRAVLSGRFLNKKAINNYGSSFQLRRNIHRIEKGLVMRPRREFFAESFIYETICLYGEATKSKVFDCNESKWASDVLDEYFSVVNFSPVIEKSYNKYKSFKDGFYSAVVNKKSSVMYKPYLYKELPSRVVGFDDLECLFIRRRSVRWYEEKNVPYELITKAVDIACLAPSACNRQPFRFMFCNNKESVFEIAECVGGTSGFSKNIPGIIVAVGDLSAFIHERDRHLIYIDTSLAVMQLMLALETLGISSCPINWPDINENEVKIKKIIELEEYEKVGLLLAVGYADVSGGIPYSKKKKSKNILGFVE